VSADGVDGVDVIVVGAGICGAAAAFFLDERGLTVLLLDRGAVSSGTTGLGEGNVLVCDKRPGPERELATKGRDLWLELGERFPAARVARKGSLVLGDGDDATQLEPALAPGTTARHDPDDLQVDPRGLARALAAEVPVREGAEVEAVAPGNVTLRGGERLTCEHVVVATGPWARELTGLPVEPRKGQLVALAAPRGLIRHKLLEAAYLDSIAGERTVAAVIEQTLDGDEVLVGSSRERVGFDATVRDQVTNAMLDRAARFVPALRDLPVKRAWCGFRAWLPDGLPAVGPLTDRVWTTTGHEGAGVALGPITGRLLAQLICQEPTDVDPGPFDPRRFP
jgi:glycine/D-amino acid oxidase-like deaminating enzyme